MSASEIEMCDRVVSGDRCILPKDHLPPHRYRPVMESPIPPRPGIEVSTEEWFSPVRCTCQWQLIPEGEGIDPMYERVVADKRCQVHGKPRH